MWTRHLLVASVALALASPAFAQTPPMSPSAPDTRGASPPSPSSDPAAAPSSRPDAAAPSRDSAAPGATGSARATGAATKFLTLQKDGEHISSDLIGMSVVNSAGENVGKISNLIIDKDNRMTGAVLSVGGFLGLGAKSVALPWDALKIASRDNRQVAVIAMSNDEIVNAPDFKTLAQVKAEADAPRRPPGAPASPMTAPRSSQ